MDFRALCVHLRHASDRKPIQADRRPHQLMVKPHDGRTEQALLPPGRTLFILNAPAIGTVRQLHAALTQLFRKHAHLLYTVVRQHGQTLRSDDRTAETRVRLGAFVYAVMEDADAMPSLLTLCDTSSKRPRSLVLDVFPHGCLHRWRSEAVAGIPDRHMYQQEMDAEMMAFDQREAQRQKELQSGWNEVDEEGWVTVKRGAHRRNVQTDGEISVKTTSKYKNLQPAKKKYERVDFYQFQQRQAKRDKLAELRAKFEMDKQRLAQLKATRRFKPY